MMDSSGALPPFGRGIVCNTNLYRVWRLGIHLIYLLIYLDFICTFFRVTSGAGLGAFQGLLGERYKCGLAGGGRPPMKPIYASGGLHCQHGSISWLFIIYIIIYKVIYIYIYIYERHKIMQNMMLHDITDIPVTGFLFHSNGRGVSSCSWQYLQDFAKGELQVCRLYPCFPSSFSFMMGKQSLPDALCCCKEKTSCERLWNAILSHPGYCRPWNESAGTRRIDNNSCTTVLSSLCGCLLRSTTVFFPVVFSSLSNLSAPVS